MAGGRAVVWLTGRTVVTECDGVTDGAALPAAAGAPPPPQAVIRVSAAGRASNRARRRTGKGAGGIVSLHRGGTVGGMNLPGGRAW